MRAILRKPIADLARCLDQLADAPRPGRSMAVVVVALVLTWFVYVPIHELMHALGCMATGGSVTELEIAPQYGGSILARWIPFVVSGGDYAGRLTGFDTKGSDLIYLATDFGPFLLSVLFGVTMLRLCGKRRRPVLLGAGIVVGLAPFYNLFGDYYEMGSVMVTHIATIVTGGGGEIAFAGIRADDIFKLTESFITSPSELGLNGPGQIATGACLAIISGITAVALAFLTYALGTVVANILLGRAMPHRPDHAGR